MNKINPTKIKRILIIKPRGIGDILLSTIILDNLKQYFPDASIDYMVESFAKDALINNPLINRILIFDKSKNVFHIAKLIRKEGYDLIIDSWSNPRTAQITLLSMIKYRVGYSYRGRKYAYNLKATSSRGEDHHSAEHNLELLRPLGISNYSYDLKYFTSQDDDIYAQDFMKNHFIKEKKLFGIIPSGGWNSKRCDSKKWVDIASSLLQRFDSQLLLLWGPGDEDDVKFIEDKMNGNIVVAPKTTINQMAALIKQCSAIIANDSGPMHISAALNVPTLGIFGPTNPKTFGPYGKKNDTVRVDDLDCIECNLLECNRNHECMQDLNVEIILDKIREMLSK